MRRVGHFSAGIGRVAGLAALLEARVDRIHPGQRNRPDVLVGWGRKPSWTRARAFANRHDLPLWTLEDGFYRSLGLGVNGAPAHSLIVDPQGIYFDATGPSRFESMMLEDHISSELRHRAAALMATIREARLSKYNAAPDAPLPPNDGRPRVLVVDQTLNDASVDYGMADAEAFRCMLAAAKAEQPDAELLVRTHPDVLAGRKRGYLLDMARETGGTLLAEPRSPWAVLDAVDVVYTVTSQLGFEALLAGREVHCFGMPFYAGWGLTRDRQSHPRRGVPRDLLTLFANAVIRYPIYLNPYTAERCTPEATIGRLAEQYRQQESTRGRWLGVGLSRRKRRFVQRFLGAGAELRRTIWTDAVNQWESDETPVIAWGITAEGLLGPMTRAEDGFLRSVGLGADMVEPLSLVIDHRGIYYDPQRPSDLEVLLAGTDFSAALCERARALRERIVALGLSKYNVGRSQRIPTPTGRRVVLVPGQVETDASIMRGTGDIRTNQALLEAARAAEPDAWLVYKPHPDVSSGARRGGRVDTDGLADAVVVDADMPGLLECVDVVHTMTSLAGFEALLRGVPVATHGLPFYAGWGLTEDRLEAPRRGRALSLDELVAGALILYPRYLDPTSRELIDVETAVSLLEQWRRANPSARLAGWQQVYRWLRRRY